MASISLGYSDLSHMRFPDRLQFHHVYLEHVPPMTPFIWFLEEYEPTQRDVQIVTRSQRVAYPLPVDRPFAGTTAREDVQREDDEILRQLHTTQAHVSIWSLLASSITHRDALIRALSQIRVDTTATLEGLIHFLTADRAYSLMLLVQAVGCRLSYWTTAPP